ncbi:PREDICTED: uncharacterized protein LOC100637192 [Amphimedon queenslandica]|uniref:Uncharacterized protein n=1 Tax=Amphimedon queenslandica TaxID=400682 RepID=A0A1X7VXU1_AMPQE|nr:PREDICTED: uncharacterized protein LOC100637192 [Amphimedon queenslandica]|eukprot:XP_003382544.1 PREDICTED: uncharacterized protein LOC100637192 [Amphimedon queenslandica]
MALGLPNYRDTFAGFSKHFWAGSIPKDRWNELVWVDRWYNPLDNRSRTPSQRHKFLAQSRPNIPQQWTLPEISQPLGFFSRSKEQQSQFPDLKTRCERWSTLREMLPSRGHTLSARPPKWGTNESRPPVMSARRPKRYPHLNSPMTNYIDDMHKSDRLFRLY